MTMQFCNDCGDLLPGSQTELVKCQRCGKVCKETVVGVSVSSPNDFPSELRDEQTINMPKTLSSEDTWCKTDVKCRECGAEEVQYTSLQLRSADEGTAMSYSCPKCSARWNENN